MNAGSQGQVGLRWMWLLVAALYVASLPLPAVYQHGFGAPTSGLSGGVVPGYAMVGRLPLAMLSVGWWANPLWLFGLIALARGNALWSLVSGLLAATLALLTLVIGAFPPDPFELSHFHAGYYVWLTSMVALPVCAAVLRGFENSTWNPVAK